MTPADLSLTVLHAVRRAVDDGALRVDVPPVVKVERARPGGVGDYASNVALALARSAGRSALDIAGILEERLRGTPGLREVAVTGPGFLNFTLRSDAGGELVRAIREAGESYGSGTALAGVTVRFADLTESRALIVTETVVRLLRSQGADVAVHDQQIRQAPQQIHPLHEQTHQTPERIHVHPGPYEPDLLGPDAAGVGPEGEVQEAGPGDGDLAQPGGPTEAFFEDPGDVEGAAPGGPG
ncbi:hypothetical protein EAO70_31475, partial [Streptomyces sp. adm13(2018)]